MREADLTPEDKLLEIIENPSQTAAVTVAPTPAVVKDLPSLLLWIKAFKPEQTAQKIKMEDVNKAFLALCIVLTVLAVWFLRNNLVRFDVMFDAIGSGVLPAGPAEAKAPLRSVNFTQTLTMAKEHNIFTLQHGSTSAEGLMVGDGQATANLKLVGILWSEKPQAMVEDTVDQKTYLLYEGDQVARLVVKSIQKDKVILAKDDRVWELR